MILVHVVVIILVPASKIFCTASELGMSFKFRSEGEFEFEATKLLLLLEGKEGKSGSAAVRVICCPS